MIWTGFFFLPCHAQEQSFMYLTS